MVIPDQTLGLAQPEVALEILQHAEIVERVDLEAIATPIARDVARPAASLGSSAGSG